MAITLFGSASTPTDNGAYATSPVAVTPPSNMQAGDLVFVTVCFAGTSGTLTVNEPGGQTWTSLTQRDTLRNRTRSFWCVFNGTWVATPSWTGSGTSNVIARMLVFRPSTGVLSWSVDSQEVSATYAAPASPYTVTIPAISTYANNVLVIAGWTSADDNQWGSLTGGWTALNPAQVRNTSGTYDQSQTHAYKVQASPGGTGTVSQNQSTLGGDAGTRIIIAFKEAATDLVSAEGNETQGSDTPAITQVHNITVDECYQATVSDNAALYGQVTPLVRVINELLEPRWGDIVDNLVPDEGVQTQESDSLALTQNQLLVSDEGIQIQGSDTPNLTQLQILAPADGVQTQASDTPVVTQLQLLVSDEGVQTQLSDAPAITQSQPLVADEGAQTQLSDGAVITQLNLLAPQEGVQTQASDNAVIDAIGHIVKVINEVLEARWFLDLIAAGGVQAQTSDNAALTQSQDLVADDGYETQASDEPALTQTQILAPQEGTQEQVSANAVIEAIAHLVRVINERLEPRWGTIDLVPAEGVQTQASDNADMGAIVHLVKVIDELLEPRWPAEDNLIAAEGVQTQVSANAVLGFFGALVKVINEAVNVVEGPFQTTAVMEAQEGAQEQVSDPADLVLNAVSFVPAEGYQTQLSDVPVLGGMGDLLAAEGVQIQTSDAPAITQVQDLVADEGVQVQVSDNADLSFVAQENYQTQASDTPSLTQVQNLVPAEGVQTQISDQAMYYLWITLMIQEGYQSQHSAQTALQVFESALPETGLTFEPPWSEGEVELEPPWPEGDVPLEPPWLN